MESALEQRIAETILQHFDLCYGQFLEITRGAQNRFEQADWQGVQDAQAQRIKVYDHHVGETAALLKLQMGEMYASQPFLRKVKTSYIRLLRSYPNYEVAESFYNSVYRRIYHHRNIDPANLFILSSHIPRARQNLPPLTRSYHSHGGLVELVRQILEQVPFTLPYEDLQRDLGCIEQLLASDDVPEGFRQQEMRAEMAKEVFYRNKGAYLVGLLQAGEQEYPLVLPLLNNEQGGVYLDSLVYDWNEVSIIFGFARSYFMVNAPVPAELVKFLHKLMPNKTDYEIYTAIGCQKHGKSEFYRHFLNHLNLSKDQFVSAPGIKGMVMCVFTLPSYDTVFKVIKDRFDPPKDISKEKVKQKYYLVKEHDRLGRMADTQEFTNFELPRARFSEALLKELLEVAPSAVELHPDRVVIRHLYTERKMIPLNIFLENADEQQIRLAIDEYGNAIKQLAAANIFPGDMLFKNFGITRHGRVIFYDYDEICYMTECHFRHIPPPRYPEDELSAEPWYSVAPNDVFPEEFATFLLGKPLVRKIFYEYHKELLDADYWSALQARILAGEFEDVFPYGRHQRFQPHRG